MSQLAVEYVRAGLALVEIRPGSKAPILKEWQKAEHAICTEEEAAKLPDDAALGLAHRWCRTCALDVDDIKLAETWLALRNVDLAALQAASDRVMDVSGKEGRAKLIYRLPEGVEWLKTVRPQGSGLELRNATAEGLTVQDLIYPSPHPEGTTYQWDGDWRNLPTLPDSLLALWQKLLEPAPKTNGAKAARPQNGAERPTRSLDECKDALIYVPSDEYETWIKVGMGLHDNFHGDETGLALWEEWSKDSDKFKVGDCEAKWRSFKPNGGVTGAAIFALAKEHGAPVADMARRHARKPQTTQQLAPKTDTSQGAGKNVVKAQPAAAITWVTLGLPLVNGRPAMDMHCALKVLRGVPRWAGRVHYDSFVQKIFLDSEPLTDRHDYEFLEYLQGELGMYRFPPQASKMAMRAYGFANQRDCIMEWLMTDVPVWDGVPRCASIFPDLFGAKRTEYTEQAGVNFMRSLCARILKPGCMVKHMVILEGAQDAGKSKMLRILVGTEWFTEQHERAENKDFFMIFRGKALIEVSELDAFSKSDVTRIKQVVSCESDRYRSPYGESAEDHPRRCVLVGTTNKDDYLHDDTGGVRFWPIRCTELNFDSMAEQRLQLFAEARDDILRGEPWWHMPLDETKQEQDERYSEDPWREKVAEACIGKVEVNVVDLLLSHHFGFLMKDIKRPEQNRIASCLRSLGWENRVTRRGSRLVRIWTQK